MKEKILQFLEAEIAAADSDARKRNLKTIRGYLTAAQALRATFDTKRGHEYTRLDDRADQFDLDCIRSEQ